MNKKSIFIVVCVLVLLFISYKIASNVIIDAVDDSNERAVELYATNIRYAYAKSYLNQITVGYIDVNNLDITSTVDVKCEERFVDSSGNVELHGCSVENSKAKYKYVKGKAERE